MSGLVAERRTIFGKMVKKLRNAGRLPGIVYGNNKESVPIELDLREFVKTWRIAGESSIVDLSVKDLGQKNVLIHDVSLDTVKDIPIHVDLYEIDVTKPIRTHVPIKFIGESEAVKSLGGVLVKVLHEIEIEALPLKLPHEIEVDISKIATFEDHITLRDLKLGEGVSAEGEVDSVVAKVAAPRTEEEIENLEELPAEADLESIEVEKKGKKEIDMSEEESEKSEKSESSEQT